MTTSPAPTLPRPVPAPRRRWLRGIGLVIGLIIVGVIIVMVYSHFAVGSAWREAEAEAAQDLARWRLLELDEDREEIPDEENSALSIKALHRKGKGVSFSGVPRYDVIFEKLPENAQLNQQQLELLRGQHAKIAREIEEARKLKDMPRGRFYVKYSDDFIATLIPDHQNARELGDWLQHDAWLLAQDQDYDTAVESCQALVNAGRTMADDPFLISHLIRLAIQQIALTSLERVLAQGEVSEARLEAAQKQIAKEMKDTTWLPAMRGERAGIHHLFCNIRDGKVKTTWMSMLNGPVSKKSITDSIVGWFGDTFPSTMLKHYPEYLRHSNRGVEIAKLPLHERGPKLKEWEKKAQTTTNPVIRLLAPAVAKLHQRECHSQAMLRSAAVALACERYRVKHESWPESLELLVKGKWIDAIPLDPMDGKPLRYRRSDDGVVIYSIGKDLTDNQGTINRQQEPYLDGFDIGFRLWDLHKRRQDPLPPIALDVEKQP